MQLPPYVLDYKMLTYKGKEVFNKAVTKGLHRDLKPFHENEACFGFVNKGTFHARGADKHLVITPDQAFFAKCYNFYAETDPRTHEDPEVVEFMSILLYKDIVEELMDLDLSKPSTAVDYNMKQFELDSLLDHFRATINIWLDNPEMADEEMIGVKLKEFILLLLKKAQVQDEVDFLAGLYHVKSTPFTDTIENNIFSTLSLEELATLCNMSVSSFKRKFDEMYGEPPKKYITRRKIEKAQQLLRSPDMRVSDVAFDSGFESLATFNRNFHSETGFSPSEYRLSLNE